MLYYDLFILLMVFLVTLLADFTKRSIQFNIVSSGLFLLKCLIGARYIASKSYTSLRYLTATRLLVDGLLIMPCIFIYRSYSATSSYNLLMVFFIATVSELFIVLRHFGNLFFVSTVECIE